jgi:uncharacterized integral membrane protein
MRIARLLVAVLLALAAVTVHATARVQVKMLCWDPDMEFPVACDDNDD